ncbi:unnamed protein product [Periconia digitata]|uniref:Uncharacterized protein n=1 Tax=Periconia digitata TaxID=1303443 RepID=A0A9W4XIC9_9PLEO|nr:unnamed protein product [Periconia digitata]
MTWDIRGGNVSQSGLFQRLSCANLARLRRLTLTVSLASRCNDMAELLEQHAEAHSRFARIARNRGVGMREALRA